MKTVLAYLVLGILSVGCLALAGCGSSEEEPKAETQESKQMATESATKWTPEQVKKFEQLNKEARGVSKGTETGK